MATGWIGRFAAWRTAACWLCRQQRAWSPNFRPVLKVVSSAACSSDAAAAADVPLCVGGSVAAAAAAVASAPHTHYQVRKRYRFFVDGTAATATARIIGR
jgi:hypothetical protein